MYQWKPKPWWNPIYPRYSDRQAPVSSVEPDQTRKTRLRWYRLSNVNGKSFVIGNAKQKTQRAHNVETTSFQRWLADVESTLNDVVSILCVRWGRPTLSASTQTNHQLRTCMTFIQRSPPPLPPAPTPARYNVASTLYKRHVSDGQNRLFSCEKSNTIVILCS